MSIISASEGDSKMKLQSVRVIVTSVLLFAIAYVPQSVIATEDDRPLDEQPYVGVSVRHDADANKCIVSWIYPGPLNGQGFVSEYMQRCDYILKVDNAEVHTPDEFKDALATYNPGDTVTFLVHRTEGNLRASVPAAGEGTTIETVTIQLDSRATWSGPVHWLVPKADRINPNDLIRLEGDQTPMEKFIYKHLDENDIREPIEKLVTYFNDTIDGYYGKNMLDRVAYGFAYPTRLDILQELITDPLPAIAKNPANIFTQAANNLDAKCTSISETINLANPNDAIINVASVLVSSKKHLDSAFQDLKPNQLEEIHEIYPELIAFVADNFYINDHPEVKSLIDALNASMIIDFDELLNAANMFSGIMQNKTLDSFLTPEIDDPDATTQGIPLPQALFDSVEGDVRAVLNDHGRWLVYGGYEANTYDLSIIDVVIDPGGNDTYYYSANDRPQIQLIIDKAGNDIYDNNEDTIPGPASALCGISILIDDAGDDIYKGAAQSCGVGVLGVGILVDNKGADQYTGTQWSCGAAFYGVGAILDLGPGNDIYTTESFSQAIGGPRGFGLIVDAQGRDLYRNNGPIPSVYGTQAVYSGISQGVGFGVRGFDTGGIGVLCDLSGADRYEAGEFSQGGAYYWGLGILYDKSGRDLYYGNRYTQGFAAHQALGILADDEGDDTYWGMTAATQSGSWDICATLLIDRAGNDTYQADGLAQGGASMQAIAWLIDLDGNDRYNAPKGSTQGQSGGNSYHYDSSGCYSFSLLLDAGGSIDLYSGPNRADGVTITTGAPNPDKPENSNLYGLFIDTAEKVIFEN